MQQKSCIQSHHKWVVAHQKKLTIPPPSYFPESLKKDCSYSPKKLVAHQNFIFIKKNLFFFKVFSPFSQFAQFSSIENSSVEQKKIKN